MKDFKFDNSMAKKEEKALAEWMKAMHAQQYGTKKNPNGIEYTYELKIPEHYKPGYKVYTPAEQKATALQDEVIQEQLNLEYIEEIFKEQNKQKAEKSKELLDALRGG